MKTVVLSPRAAKQLDDLPLQTQDQILEALDAYAMQGVGDIKKMSDRSSYRLRVGRYRVVFDEDRVRVLAIYIGKRETTTYHRN